MGGTLLVSNEYVLDLVLLEDGVVDVQNGAPGISEDVLDALVDQGLNDDLGTSQLHVGNPPSTP